MDQVTRPVLKQIRRRSTGSEAISRRFCSRAIVSAPAIALSFLLIATGLFAAAGPGEYQIKAAFVLNFTKFIEWPSAAFENSASPLTICIYGDDPFGNELDQVMAGEVVNGRKLAVQRLLRRAPNPKLCQVLFVSKSEKDVSGLIAGLGPGVLTISDRDRFLMDGGMIALVTEDQHVRFDVSQRAALKALLTMNARMLNVARSVQK